MKHVTVFYEDQFAQTKSFEPHELAIACVVDRRAGEDELRRRLSDLATAHPCKGIDNLIKKVTALAERGRYKTYGAVVDNDRIRDRNHLHLAPTATPKEVVAALLLKASALTWVVLLQENLDDVAQVVAQTLGETVAKKPTPEQRDELFRKLVWSNREKRSLFLASCGSFRELVEFLHTSLPDSA